MMIMPLIDLFVTGCEWVPAGAYPPDALALFLVLIVPTLICVGAVAAVIAGIHIAFANATGASAVLGIFLQVLFGLAAFTIALLVGVALGGPLGTAIREYALLFYGSRYQLLGNILAPPPQASPKAPGMA